MMSSGGAENLYTTSNLNLFMPVVCATFDTFHKMNNFSFNDSTNNTGRTANPDFENRLK